MPWIDNTLYPTQLIRGMGGEIILRRELDSKHVELREWHKPDDFIKSVVHLGLINKNTGKLLIKD